MSIVRGIIVSLISVLLLLAVAGCQSAAANAAAPATASQTVATISAPATPPVNEAVPDTWPEGAVVWGKVPYCNCLATSATANVADALQKANLTVSLKELSPSDGWLYFAVRFDPATTTDEQVATAMKTGGAEVLSGPP